MEESNKNLVIKFVEEVKNERKLLQILKHNKNMNGNKNNISMSDTLQKLYSINTYNEDMIQI